MRELPQMKMEIEVGGYKYIATHPDPDTAHMMGTELMRLVGESVSAMVDGSGGGEKATQALQNAARLLLQKLDPKTHLDIVKKVLAYVELQKDEENTGKFLLTDINRKLHFQGRHGDMEEVAMQALVFQQRDFFLAMKRILTGMMTKMKE